MSKCSCGWTVIHNSYIKNYKKVKDEMSLNEEDSEGEK